MALDRRDRQNQKGPAKGLKKLWDRLFPQKPEPEEDLRSAVSFGSHYAAQPQVRAAQAPSRSQVAAAASRKKDLVPRQSAEPYQPTPRQAPESRVPVQGNRLYQLYCRINGSKPNAKTGSTFSLSLFMDKDAPPNAEQRTWLRAIEREVRAMPQYADPNPDPDHPEEPPLALPTDACAFVRIADDGMAAYLFILPPLEGGTPLTKEWVYHLLEEEKVTVGVAHEVIEQACSSGEYLRLIPIASGLPPQPGEDGRIIDHFSREVEVRLKVQDDNTIDFKDLGWLQTVREGEVICDILMPTAGIPGMTVRGNEVPAPDGRPAAPPEGPGTRLSEDGSALLASMDGVLSFIGNGFRVDPLLIVKGDVDNAVGNLDVIGDILVYGDIRDGFTVKASGNITVQGLVEKACVTAGGDVRISLGMNGCQDSFLRAGGNVLCKFIENANVAAGGMVVCDSIVHSTVHSDTFIRVTTGRGTIIGGEVRALESVEANTVGNEGGRMLTVILGSTTALLEEMQALEEKLDALAAEIADKEKNIAYLTPLEEALGHKERIHLDDLRQGIAAQKMQLANLERQATALACKQQDFSRCFLQAKALHPPLQLIIGDIAAELRQPLTNVVVRRIKSEIKVEDDSTPKIKTKILVASSGRDN